MIITEGYGPFPSGLTYYVDEAPDPSSPDVHSVYRLMQKAKDGDLQPVTPATEPYRTAFTVSSWRDDHLEDPTPDPNDRPLVRLPDLGGLAPENVYTPEEAWEIIMEHFKGWIEAQEGTGSPERPELTGDGLEDLRALMRSMDSNWELPTEDS